MTTKYDAFIDNGKIKIVNSYGVEYDDILSRQKKKLNIYFYISVFFLFVSTSSILTVLSPLFFTDFSRGQPATFFVLSIIFMIAFVFTLEEKKDQQRDYNNNNYEYNLAKKNLQPRIMELQKELCTHETEMQNIKNRGKFDFKKPVEMSA